MYERFTDRARKVMQLANQEAQRFNHEYIGTEHILLGLVAVDSGVAANALKNLDVDLRNVRKEVEKIVECGPEMVTMGKLPMTPRAKKIIEYAIEEAHKLDKPYVGTEHLLLGTLREQEGVAAQVLMNLGLKLDDVRRAVLNLLGTIDAESARGDVAQTGTKPKPRTTALDAFGRDLTELARQDKLDPLIGRQAQLQALAEVLGCRQRNSAVLLAEGGSGRTAIVAGLARAIAARAMDWLEGYRVIELSPQRLWSGARDEAARLHRLHAVVGEVSRSQGIILFLPGALQSLIASPVDSAQESAHAEWLDAMRRGELRCILTGTPAEYQECLGRKVPLERCCQPVLVPPATVEETLAILAGLRDRYEKHHQVRFTDEALATVAELADRHLPGALPGKALLLLDHAGARGRGKSADASREVRASIARLEVQIERFNMEKTSAVAQHAFDQAAQLRDQAERLKKQRDALTYEEKHVRQTHGGTIEAADVADTLTQLTGDTLPPEGSSFIAPVGGPEN